MPPVRQFALRVIPLLFLAWAAYSQINSYRAQIIVDQGVPPPTSPMIRVDPSAACVIQEVFGTGMVVYEVPPSLRSDSCPVTIQLSGYRKNEAALRNGAVIVMKRPGSYANPTVSLTTLAAPEDARKAFEKGVAAMLGKKWAAAQKEFERAVAAYPEYAPAWGALGEVLVEESQAQPARQAFERALKADSKFASAWAQLARLAADEGRMQDALAAAERALQLDATGFPAVYASQAMADLALERVDAAEKSARRAVELDTFHEIPLTERVLGSVLAAKGDREGAIQHWRKYLEMSPDAADAADVQKRINNTGHE
ncbi:MAG TPA: tetratricopeptide repeat protein [Bryobacteraceae bacterium]|nr:tetratricopeptide repeat protein [Bryobacteraceae bacterium]